MSSSKRSIVISRSYELDEEYCARALELLLKNAVKKAVPADRPENARKEDLNASGSRVSISR